MFDHEIVLAFFACQYDKKRKYAVMYQSKQSWIFSFLASRPLFHSCFWSLTYSPPFPTTGLECNCFQQNPLKCRLILIDSNRMQITIPVNPIRSVLQPNAPESVVLRRCLARSASISWRSSSSSCNRAAWKKAIPDWTLHSFRPIKYVIKKLSSSKTSDFGA